MYSTYQDKEIMRAKDEFSAIQASQDTFVDLEWEKYVEYWANLFEIMKISKKAKGIR